VMLSVLFKTARGNSFLFKGGMKAADWFDDSRPLCYHM